MARLLFQAIIATIIALVLCAACVRHDPLFCDQNHPCDVPGKPELTYCDLMGVFPESEGHGKSCIHNPFDASPPDAEAPDAELPCGPQGCDLTVALSGSGVGVVASSPPGVSCGTGCSATYSMGTQVTLSATPSAGSTFTGWSGACSGQGSCTVTMDAAKSVTAWFGIAGEHIWSHAFGDQGMDDGLGVAFDSTGNVYAVGHFDGTAEFSDGLPIVSSSADGYVAKYAPDGGLAWVRRIGGLDSDAVAGVAAGSDGSVFVTGQFWGAVDFGDGDIKTSNGSYDVFVLKLRPDGTTAWAVTFGGTERDTGMAIAVVAGGSLVVGGTFAGSINFGGGPLGSFGGTDGFLLWLTPDGVYVRARTFGGSGEDVLGELALDRADDVVVTGTFQGAINFAGPPLVSAGSTDAWLAKYTASGGLAWAKRLGGTQADAGSGVAVDQSDSVYVAGSFQGDADFDGISGTEVSSAGADDIVIAKYSAAGGHVWTRRLGGAGSEKAYDVGIDDWGHMVVTGEHAGGFDFGDGTQALVSGFADIFVAGYATGDGSYRWARTFGSDALAGWERGRAVAVHPDGAVAVTGTFHGLSNFGGATFNTGNFMDVFVARYGP